MNPHHHLAALSGALARWEACSPGPASDGWARQIAAALRLIVADGYGVALSVGGYAYLLRPSDAGPRIPPRLARIAGVSDPLPLGGAEPAHDAPAGALAAEGPLTADELAALSRLGWSLTGAPDGAQVKMADTHADGWPEEVRTPGGWRALL